MKDPLEKVISIPELRLLLAKLDKPEITVHALMLILAKIAKEKDVN